MLRFLGWLLVVLGLPLLAALALLDPRPLVIRDGTLSPASVAQARRLLAANDPRRLKPGEARTVAIPAALIGDGLNYLAGRAFGGRAALALGEEAAEVRISRSLGPRYLNLSAVIREGGGEPRIAEARLGALPVPAALAQWALESAIAAAGFGDDWALARRSLLGVSFEPAARTVTLAYVWQPQLLSRARAMALPPDDVARLKAAQTTLAALLDHRAASVPVPLVEVLRPLLAPAGRDERRATLLALAAYVAGKDLAPLVPEARGWPRPRPVALTLRGRHDIAQHFAVSAALAAWAGEPVADAIGLYKELDDARRGSGFSFADLAADRAGTRFGELVAGDDRRLDAALAAPLADADLAPSLAGLPEYLHAPEFRRRFGGPGSAPYRRLTADIEGRLDALPLYQQP